MIEKPFGTDLASARALQEVVHSVFRERQVFRIDHYLGKETVQNVMAFRFANYMFEPVWNRNYIDHIQITAAEDIGIGTRAGYYDSAGALRDLVQNHMLQLLTLVCMEPPTSFEANKVRDEKVKVLQAIEPPTPEQVAEMTVRARYTAGVVGGEEVPGYLEEEGVPEDSTTETYAALKLEVHNWRWAGVPIFLRTGKRLARKVTEIAVQLKPVPHMAFQSKGSVGVQPNQLILTMQPNEGVSLSLGAKIPGASMRIRPVNMEFLYGTSFMSQSPEAYERLILDAMRGDATLFTRNDEVDAQWSIIDPILQTWAAGSPPLAEYEAGTPGPAEADELIGEGRHWRALVVDEVWSERDTTPARIEAALRDIVTEHHHSDHPFVPARVLNVVVVVDGEFRGEIENRLERVGRYHPSRLVLCAVEDGRETIDAWAGVGTDDAEPTPGAHRGRARARGDRDRPAPPVQARHDRRPAARLRPGDDGVGAARPHAGARLAAPAGADRARRQPGRARRDRGAAARRRPRPATPTSSTSRGCARRRGASAWRPRSTRRRCARRSPASPASPSATARTRSPPRCCSAAGCPRGSAGRRSRWRARGDGADRPRARPPAGGPHQPDAGRPGLARARPG